MSLSRATERSVLSKELLDLISKTHHPAIYDIDAKDLRNLRTQLRNERSKIQTQVRGKIREGRGKGDPRGKGFPGNTEQPLKRKQALSSALKRINKELERLRKLEARSTHVEAAKRALAIHRSAKFHPTPVSDKTANTGMQPQPSTKRRKIIPGSQIGSVSQATKNAQAKSDKRGKNA